METSYSTIAVKYVGSTPALNAMEVLQGLRADGTLELKEGVAVTRSTGGEMSYYPIQSITPRQGAMRLGVAGFVLGLLLGRPLRWAMLGAGVGLGVSAMSKFLRKEEALAIVPYVEKNESVLYMQVIDADWTVFWAEVIPYLEEGKMVVRTLAPAHTELARLLSSIDGSTEIDAQESRESETAGSLQPVSVQPEAARKTTEPVPDDKATDAEATDDLTAIKGIGPVIGLRMQEGGIRSYAQLAGVSVEQIAQIAGVSASRVVSNDWIGQAAELAAQE